MSTPTIRFTGFPRFSVLPLEKSKVCKGGEDAAKIFMEVRFLRSFITSTIKAGLFYGGAFALHRRLRPSGGVAILRYHAVQRPEQNFYASPSITLSPKDFERQVRYFVKRYRVISMDTVVNCLREERPFPKNAIVFTFDDGYADNYYHAYQILKKYGVTGTFYMTVGCVGNTRPFWVAEVNQLIRFTSRKRFEIVVDEVTHPYALAENEASILRIMGQVTWLIKSYPIETRELILQQLREQLGHDEVQRKLPKTPVMLTWEQVREMVDGGMTIGGHTMTHANLPSAKPESAYEEISRCKRVLEEKLGITANHFSYPNGGCEQYFNDTIRGYVQQVGFLSATISVEGHVRKGSDLLTLPRVRTGRELYDIGYRLDVDRS